MLHELKLTHDTDEGGGGGVTVNTIRNKNFCLKLCCAFELSIHQGILKKRKQHNSFQH